jgi:hypothetical protein
MLPFRFIKSLYARDIHVMFPVKCLSIFEKGGNNSKSPIYYITFINKNLYTNIRLPAVHLQHNKAPTEF